MRFRFDPEEPFRNAFWDPDHKQMVFGEGYGAPLDATAHEIAHGVILSELPGFSYKGENGALGEAIADMFASNIDENWTIGENLPGGALRNMEHPDRIDYVDRDSGRHIKPPAHARDYVKTTIDKGGVHINAGIPNRAYVLMVKALGRDASERILYDAVTKTPRERCRIRGLPRGVPEGHRGPGRPRCRRAGLPPGRPGRHLAAAALAGPAAVLLDRAGSGADQADDLVRSPGRLMSSNFELVGRDSASVYAKTSPAVALCRPSRCAMSAFSHEPGDACPAPTLLSLTELPVAERRRRPRSRLPVALDREPTRRPRARPPSRVYFSWPASVAASDSPQPTSARSRTARTSRRQAFMASVWQSTPGRARLAPP